MAVSSAVPALMALLCLVVGTSAKIYYWNGEVTNMNVASNWAGELMPIVENRTGMVYPSNTVIDTSLPIRTYLSVSAGLACECLVAQQAVWIQQ